MRAARNIPHPKLPGLERSKSSLADWAVRLSKDQAAPGEALPPGQKFSASGDGRGELGRPSFVHSPMRDSQVEETLPLTARVVASKTPLSCVLDGETVILNLKSGVYYGIDPVGTWIWNQLREPMTVAAIRDAMLAKYEVEAGQCERDLLALLQELMAAGLVDVTYETNFQVSSSPAS